VKLFEYQAKDEKGKTVKGKVEANDVDQAARILRDRNLVIVKLVEFVQAEELSFVRGYFDRVQHDDIVEFTRQLATMVEAGLPLTDALSLLRAQSKPGMGRLVDDVLRDVESGKSLADALARHKEEFSEVFVELVRAGETAGMLDNILKRVADNLEKQRNFRAKTRGVLIYPAIVVSGMFVVALVMIVFVIPKLTVMYEDFGADLPMMTQILIGLSKFVTQFWYVFFTLLFAGAFFLRSWKRTETGKLQYDQLKLKLPVFGRLTKIVALAEMTRTLSLLVAAGISIIEALGIVADSVGNEVYRKDLKKAAKEVEKGIPLAVSMAKGNNFPPLVPQMVSVGEETGKVDEILAKLSSYFETESEHLLKGLTSALEPIIMIVLGVGVGFLIVAIIMPIYNLTSQF